MILFSVLFLVIIYVVLSKRGDMNKILFFLISAILLFSFSCTKTVKPEEAKKTCCPNEAFCGESTLGQCQRDSDCTKGGCSGQICQSVTEGLITTTCEWRECYDPATYCLECACENNQCKWMKK